MIEEGHIDSSMQGLLDETGRQFVILFDEWDCLFRVFKDDAKAQYNDENALSDTISLPFMPRENAIQLFESFRAERALRIFVPSQKEVCR